VAATKVAIAFSVIIESGYPIFNRSVCLNSEKKFNGGVTSRGVLLKGKKRLSVNSKGGDDTIIIFGISGLRVFRGVI
jgi:hypothetical protein